MDKMDNLAEIVAFNNALLQTILKAVVGNEKANMIIDDLSKIVSKEFHKNEKEENDENI